MFNKISMAGTGNYMKIASALYIIGQGLGLLPQDTPSSETLLTLAISLFVLGEAWTQIGTWWRSDLNWGIFRKKPLN